MVEAATIAIALAADVLLGQLLAGRLLHVPTLIPPRDLRHRRERDAENCSIGLVASLRLWRGSLILL